MATDPFTRLLAAAAQRLPGHKPRHRAVNTHHRTGEEPDTAPVVSPAAAHPDGEPRPGPHGAVPHDRAWGTDDVGRKGGDYFGTAADGLPVQRCAASIPMSVHRLDSGEVGALDLVVPALPGSLRDIRVAMRRWLSAVGAAPRTVADLLVAVGEASTNAVEHAYGPGGGTVKVHMELHLPDVLATVRDTGCWRPPRCENRENRGRGTLFMRSCSDDLRIGHGPTGTNVVIRRRLAE